MNIKKWAKNRTVRAIGLATMVLLSLSFWIYAFGFHTFIILVASCGSMMLLVGVASLIFKIFTPQMKRIAEGVLFFGVLWGGFTGLVITVFQRWIFKFPYRFTGKLMLSNSIIAAIFILWRRWEKKSEEPDD